MKKSPRVASPRLSPSFSILFVCEGVNTEPANFKQIKMRGVAIEAISVGYTTVSLVRKAEELAMRKAYDEVWCFFDKDDFAPQDFNEAICLAEMKHIHAACSNQAFGFWLLLHFFDHHGGALHRSRYSEMLKPGASPLWRLLRWGWRQGHNPRTFHLVVCQRS